jgi:peptidoglycan-N-acetylglucosamine deacetylase
MRGDMGIDDGAGARATRSRIRSLGHWPIAIYDRVYRWANGLDRPGSRVGSVLRVAVRRSGVTVRLPNGADIRRGDLVAVIHLDNEQVSVLADGRRRPEAVGLEFRRRLVASLAELAALTGPDGALRDVRACSATTILHRGLRRLGFAPALGDSGGSALAGAYQRALLAFLRPGRQSLAPGRARARRLWISRDDLRARYSKTASDSRSDHSLRS